MRVVQVADFGGPEVLVASDAPDPVAGPGQVVIDVSVVDVLFLDTQLRAGWGRDFFPLTPPYVPGNGVAGQVAGVAEDVDPAWIGRRVIARTGTRARDGGAPAAPTGGYAERAVVAVETLVEVPDGLGSREAAALVHDGPTALGLADRAQIRTGEWVLITAAGGSLGVVLLQLARAAGARVIGAARGERKLRLVRELGAEAVVDYTEAGWQDRAREATGGQGVHVVFDGAGGELGEAAFEVATSGARFFAYGAASGRFAAIDPAEAERRDVTMIGIMGQGRTAAQLRRLTEQAIAEAAAGRITPFIGQTFPLERAADAHAAIAARTAIGRTLLLV
ncbi:MAG: zinc-binding dehydrogenase [Egibacteraceae bacterium]